MQKILMVVVVGLLGGCASLQNAGTASYSIKPFEKADGGLECCEVQVLNGKEIANLEAKITRKGGDFSVELKEQGVAAFKGQEVSAEAAKALAETAAKAALVGAGVVLP